MISNTEKNRFCFAKKLLNIYPMSYLYTVFGIPIRSEIVLPAFQPLVDNGTENDTIVVKIGKTDGLFSQSITTTRAMCRFNADEFLYEMPKVGKYFVKNGNEIIIQPLTDNMDSVLVFFYSNALAAALFQRNKLLIHASGIIDKNGKVWLFVAPSRVGKSTTALMLHQLGYPLFSDDIVMFHNTANKNMVTPSYPMIRIWQNTLEAQTVFDQESIYQIRPAVEKYGVLFHDTFDPSPREIAGLVFLKIGEEKIEITDLNGKEGFGYLNDNFYRKQWLSGMGKNNLKFKDLTYLAKNTSFWLASRPREMTSFKDFAEAIDKQIISKNG
ncbi:hypothetical protein CA2015_3247 [Cyclobacterium amurskyense]|uniref:HPr kinase n=2 Tax=Cyclobacterium amurskyense TaxID=320787 RepID=A0A0H4PDV5_9BACT|nr:hypothetical protein CA2015_3247 [Cyclobacterium amurskyense]